MFVYVIFAACFFSSTISAVEFVPCKSDARAPVSLEVSNCDEPPCLLRRGDKLNTSTVFTADDDHADIILGLTCTYMGVTQGYPGVDGTSQCNNIYSVPENVKVGCPLESGKMYRHELIIPLTLPMPKLTLPMKYSLKERTTRKDFVCYKLMVAVP